ncbi:hypothetical protein vseg_014818 [Gypsophila vaccaria]
MADEQPKIAYCGYIEVLDNSAMTNANQNVIYPTTDKYERTTRSKDYDKQTGAYMRGTAKETYSSGDYSNRGRVGYKDEYKSSSTVRVGDKSGYTEYYKQEKVTRVEYDSVGGSGGGNAGGGSGGRRYGRGNKYLY